MVLAATSPRRSRSARLRLPPLLPGSPSSAVVMALEATQLCASQLDSAEQWVYGPASALDDESRVGQDYSSRVSLSALLSRQGKASNKTVPA
jgi:hypothetical protein